ncbi:MAG: Asp-tRNA(Asn)/Glu-tRNA(Gln) amidotransferase subunit GatC [Actinomycetota bacterium]|nr:Asp-tRNA(Asn)/Glu-tRNA(Gln) amidotransferase subunit GatC [Actinomycetota bacterium]
MPEPLTPDVVAKVADLAMLELSDDELQTFTAQLAAVLEHAHDVEELDVDDVAPTHHPYPLQNVMRTDDPHPAVDAEVAAAALAMAPSVEDGQFRVPPALGEEP